MNRWLLLVSLLFAVSLQGLQVGAATFIAGSNIDSEPTDYRIGVYCRIDSICSLESTYGSSGDSKYREVELFVWKYWKYARATVKYLDRTRHDLRVYGSDFRGYYNGYSIGIAQTWDPHPSTSLVAGKELRRKLGVPLLTPITLYLATSVFTSDLKAYESETDMRATAKITSVLSLGFDFRQRYYDHFEYTTSIGLEVEL